MYSMSQIRWAYTLLENLIGIKKYLQVKVALNQLFFCFHYKRLYRVFRLRRGENFVNSTKFSFDYNFVLNFISLFLKNITDLHTESIIAVFKSALDFRIKLITPFNDRTCNFHTQKNMKSPTETQPSTVKYYHFEIHFFEKIESNFIFFIDQMQF